MSLQVIQNNYADSHMLHTLNTIATTVDPRFTTGLTYE